MPSSSPPASRSSTPPHQHLDRSSNDPPVLPREPKKKSSRTNKKKQHEGYSNDPLPSRGYRDGTMSDRSDVTEGREESRTSGLGRASDSGVVTDYTTDSRGPSGHKQPRTSTRGMSDHGLSDAYRKSAGRRLTQQQQQQQQQGTRNNAEEGRNGDLRSRHSRHISSRGSDEERRQEGDDDQSHILSDGSSVATERAPSRQQMQQHRRQQLSPPSSPSQRRTRSRDARRKKASREQQQRPPSRENQDIPSDKAPAVQDKRGDKGLGFKDGLRFGPKNTTLPDKFTSGPLLEQLGLDEDDIRKFMKAYGEYNKIMAKENRPGFELPADFGAMFGCQPLPQESCGDTNEAVPPPSPSADQGPPPEAGDGLPENELLQNNVKCDPPEPERTLKDLVGKTVDKTGNILDDDGSVIGKVKPDLSYLDGKTVTEDGDIVDETGKIYGKAEVVARQKPSDKKGKKPGSTFSVGNGDDDLIVNVDAHKGGISFSIHIPRPK